MCCACIQCIMIKMIRGAVTRQGVDMHIWIMAFCCRKISGMEWNIDNFKYKSLLNPHACASFCSDNWMSIIKNNTICWNDSVHLSYNYRSCLYINNIIYFHTFFFQRLSVIRSWQLTLTYLKLAICCPNNLFIVISERERDEKWAWVSTFEESSWCSFQRGLEISMTY